MDNNPKRLTQAQNNLSKYILKSGPLTVDIWSRRTLFNGELLPVPQCAFDFLVVLLRHSPNPVSYKQMVEEAHNNSLNRLEAQDLARVNVYLLRKVLEENPQYPRYIQAVDGYGYRLTVQQINR